VGIIDLYVGRPAPTPTDFDLSVSPYVFLKGTINTNITVQRYPRQKHPVHQAQPFKSHGQLRRCNASSLQIDEYIESFQPDIKLLFVRHPEHNLASLKKKFYAGVAGNLLLSLYVTLKHPRS